MKQKTSEADYVFYVRRIEDLVEAGIECKSKHKQSTIGTVEFLSKENAQKSLEKLIEAEGSVTDTTISVSQCMTCHKVFSFGKKRFVGETKVFYEHLSKEEAESLSEEYGLDVDFNPEVKLCKFDFNKLGVSHGYCSSQCNTALPIAK